MAEDDNKVKAPEAVDPRPGSLPSEAEEADARTAGEVLSAAGGDAGEDAGEATAEAAGQNEDEADALAPEEEEPADDGEAPAQASAPAELSEAAVAALIDASETANAMATAAERVGQRFQGGVAELNEHLLGIQKLNKTIVYAMSGILFFGLLVFVYMATSLTVRQSRMDATLEAVGERVVKQTAGLKALESIRDAMLVVSETQRELLMAQDRLTLALREAQGKLDGLDSSVPSALEPRIEAAFAEGMATLEGRIGVLDGAVSKQQAVLEQATGALERLSGRLSEVDTRSRRLLSLGSDLDALVTLTRERYLETLEAQLDVGDTGPRLRYPPQRRLLGDAPLEKGDLSVSTEERSE